MPSFSLQLGFCPSEADFKASIPIEDWKAIRTEAYGSVPKPCAGCGYSPESHYDLNCHIEDCVLGDKDSVVIVLLCRACHSIRHFEAAAENEWVILVNSAHSQKELVEICREGKHVLMSEIEGSNIKVLNSIDIKQYAVDLKSGKERHNDKIKVVFGKNFDWESKKAQYDNSEAGKMIKNILDKQS